AEKSKIISELCSKFLLKQKGVKNTFTAHQLHNYQYNHSTHSKIQQGFNHKRSGDVIVELEPGWISESWKDGGTTHGSSHSYDTHVPLIFWGAKVPRKNTTKLVNVKDIAPTISSILEISFPNGCTGNPLIDITK
ncbi:MAG: alkaline phosphatase family protein, partial [Flavobacteriales bacterium]|nr:alkaline phosphatase family protein [Flavobacteriales bacterium]